jgi:hypothetical protein
LTEASSLRSPLEPSTGSKASRKLQTTSHIPVLLGASVSFCFLRMLLTAAYLLRGLDLSKNFLTRIDNLFNALVNLTTLVLSDNMITEITSQTFSGLTLIQNLYLSRNRIQSIESGTFARMRLLANL